MDTLIYEFLLSFLIGAFIGIERHKHAVQEHTAGNYVGLRTFSLITVFGTLSGFIGRYQPPLFLLFSGAILILILLYYVFDCLTTKDYGITTEVALFFSYTIGVLLSYDILSQQFLIGLTVVLVLILSQKERLGSYIRGIKIEELQSFIRYTVIALVILPLLPNVSYHIGDLPYSKEILDTVHLPSSVRELELINPFQVWLFVALITGIDVLGYILGRFFGKSKGWFLTSFLGGVISSTATTQMLAQQSKLSTRTTVFVIAAIAATLASFFEHAFIILPINVILFLRVIVILVFMAILSGLLMYVFSRKDQDERETVLENVQKKDLFYLYPAIKFALLFVVVKFISAFALQQFGNSGFYFAIGVGAIPGMDAVLITIAQSAGKVVSFQTGLIAFIIANGVNLLVKCLIIFLQGKRAFAIRYIISAGIILFGGFIGVLLQL